MEQNETIQNRKQIIALRYDSIQTSIELLLIALSGVVIGIFRLLFWSLIYIKLILFGANR